MLLFGAVPTLAPNSLVLLYRVHKSLPRGVGILKEPSPLEISGVIPFTNVPRVCMLIERGIALVG